MPKRKLDTVNDLSDVSLPDYTLTRADPRIPVPYQAKMGDSPIWNSLTPWDMKPRFVLYISAHDGSARYISANAIESFSAHALGTIIKTYSGDFHVVEGTPDAHVSKLEEVYNV